MLMVLHLTGTTLALQSAFSKRENGGFSVMVWVAVSLYVVSSIMFIDRRQDS